MPPVSAPAVQAGVDAAWVSRQVTDVLDAFLADKTAWARTAGLPADVPAALGEFLAAGGKRIRPLLCVLGWHAGQGRGSAQQAVRVGAALEMFHAFALVHDDVMDRSDTRRGRPAMHRSIAARHGRGRTSAEAEKFGAGAAILAGDLALIWSDELVRGRETGLDTAQCERVLPLFDLMRSEVMYGQYLDLMATGRPTVVIEDALRIIRYKTAKYTMERPLHIGATLATADEGLLAALSAFALPLGDAFQLRDDLLGAFGRPETTGKSTLDDLREGKHTVLITHALRHADADQAELLRTLYGAPELGDEGADAVRAVLRDLEADRVVEDMIRSRYAQAVAALDEAPVPEAVRTQLRTLARQAVWRTS
ncbi:geranylgeranyl diphosphate synthase, type I [Streptomyces sp. DvalAA-14]|nr:geranylgeranyl diphosphate synthase, type I [Streptomyces sp. DvalAA-14]